MSGDQGRVKSDICQPARDLFTRNLSTVKSIRQRRIVTEDRGQAYFQFIQEKQSPLKKTT
jgi:hypothetical protein